ncbi:hypothetical protein QMZ65_23290 [Pantoea sp. EABMAA-21]|uniref:hypothetical protein n=1 Tax=Enterobacterales TaxID=91347 RepID=UPI0024B4CC8E|nr:MULTISPECIES: hypothetical protein [Enterobacterales]MDI9223614.1 hypothetical protein [Pantoea sp. EA-12]MDI9265913.1 hypothetical protein [Serratia sp. PF2-63]MDI9267119.1 hypothetical protein [Serratia sp. PF-27]MDI9280147.1 hypothetical protein [Pantoea sp. EABMAA-21]
MGRAVPLIIGQKAFASKKAAVDYFMGQREELKASGPVKNGELFGELKALYTRYCEVTQWDLSNRVIYAFSVDYEQRKNGQAWTSRLCYWVQFSPKDRLSFSVREAVDAITKSGTTAQP